MAEFYHSVTLNEEKCVGCTNCIKRCPTEAIRVRGGKAVIASERCIDCGECIRICPHHAKRARHDHLSQLQRLYLYHRAARSVPVRAVQQSGRHRLRAHRPEGAGL